MSNSSTSNPFALNHEDNKPQNKAVKICVIGHTNTGKTSLLRTLLRDVYFGEIKDETATTRHVEKAVIENQGEILLELFDTPGLEDASGVLDWLEDHTQTRQDGIDRLKAFLKADILAFNQEIKVLRQILASDLAVYVIDAREPTLGKYQDELTLLSWTAIPIMPVFNFIHQADAQNLKTWQSLLARKNLHIVAKFDSVAFQFTDEMILWQNLSLMLSNLNQTGSQTLQRLMNQRQTDWQKLAQQGNEKIADFLINVSAFCILIDKQADPNPILAQMQNQVLHAEQKLHTDLLQLYQFYNHETLTETLQIQSTQANPFDLDQIKYYGLKTTSGATLGSLIGVGIDVLAFGTTLGLGTFLGGLAGGLLPNKQNLSQQITGKVKLYIDTNTIIILAMRAIHLHQNLRQLGHANPQTRIQQNTKPYPQPIWKPEKLPAPLKKARHHPEWSAFNTLSFTTKTLNAQIQIPKKMIEEMTKVIQQAFEEDD